MENPADHVFGGHREIAKRRNNPLIDIDETLLCFGESEKAARKAYLAAVRLGCRELGGKAHQQTDALKIWLQADRKLEPDDEGPYIDVLGRSTGPERPDLSTDEFISRGARILRVDVEDLASRTRRPDVVEARRLLLALGRERWSQKANQLGVTLGKTADTISYLAREGVRQRLEDDGFAKRYEGLDRAMIGDSP